MARYGPGHKESTRRRLIVRAGQRFKRDGIDGSGVAAVVADAGLTNGAFYGHFASKEDLVVAVVAQQLAAQVAVVDALPPGADSIETFLRHYLSTMHRDELADGCPSAALLGEIVRSDEPVRDAYTEGARAMVASIAQHLPQEGTGTDDTRAISLFALIVGSLQLARAVTDPTLSERVLAAALTQASAIAQCRSEPDGRE